MQPVTAGDSHASSGSEINFGYGSSHGARVDTLWPGGVRNRLYLGKRFKKHTIRRSRARSTASTTTTGSTTGVWQSH